METLRSKAFAPRCKVIGAAGLAFAVIACTPQAPSVEAVTIDGERLRLDQPGKGPMLVGFWSTECPSCLREVPALASLQHDYGGRGVTVLAVAMAYDIPSRVVEVARATPLNYRVAYDLGGRIAGAFRVTAVPDLYLIAADGKIALHLLGEPDWSTVRTTLDRLLSES